MYDQEAIETINADQLATPTDRVLLAARFGRARPSSPSLHATRSSQEAGTRRLVTRGRARTSHQTDATVFTRRPRHLAAPWQKFTTTALVTSLVSVGTAIAVLL